MPDLIEYCHHCGNRVPQEEYGRYQVPAEDDEEFGSLWYGYFLMKCMTCGKPSVYESQKFGSFDNSDSLEDNRVERELIYPVPAGLDKCVPERIRKLYAEAAKIRNLSPNGFANQIRRSLEAICKDRGIQAGSLYASLEVLAERGEIPERLTEMTGFIRMLNSSTPFPEWNFRLV